MRRTNPAGIALIKKFEGLRLTAYRDQAGYLTIGYGHKDKTLKEGQTITQAAANAYLAADLAIAEQAVTRHVLTSLTDNQFSALVAFVFNIGEWDFRTSTLLRLVNQGNWEAAAGEFPRWDHIHDAEGIAVQDEGLLARRDAEQKLFETV